MAKRGLKDPAELADGVVAGSTRSIARAISLVESGGAEAADMMARITAATVPPGARSAIMTPRVIGVTGPPGAGKSTLINQLVRHERGEDRRVAVLAVDPSSPFSGGALLGDRIRMDVHSTDDGVYIRSMATRGHHGGLSAASFETVTILQAAGFETTIVETVGVGQSEVGILALADIVLLVLHPGAGDDIQAIKAGVMEIADLYVLNKADLPGVDALERAIRSGVQGADAGTDGPTIVRTIAADGTGVPDLSGVVEKQLATEYENGTLARRRNRRFAAAAEDVAVAEVKQWVADQGFDGSVQISGLRETLRVALEEARRQR